jgi:hypothetical protein
MARLDYRIKSDGGTLISFHYDYNDYLDEIGCVDPSVVKDMKKADEQQIAVLPQPEAINGGTTGDCELEDFEDANEKDVRKFRLGNVVKSIVARLELFNGLAPI